MKYLATLGQRLLGLEAPHENSLVPVAPVDTAIPPIEGTTDLGFWIESWEKFYRDFLDMEICIDESRIPPKQPGFDQLIIIARGLTHNIIFSRGVGCFESKGIFLVPCFGQLATRFPHPDGGIPWHERVPVVTYAIWIRGGVDADQELFKLSADQIEERGIHTMTSIERLLLFSLNVFSGGKYDLDQNTHTLCAGSRSWRGMVPVVENPGKSDRGEYRAHLTYTHPDGWSSSGGGPYYPEWRDKICAREVICDVNSPAFMARGGLYETVPRPENDAQQDYRWKYEKASPLQRLFLKRPQKLTRR